MAATGDLVSLRIGRLRHLVAVEERAVVPAPDGGHEEIWTPVQPSPVWAQVEPATPRTVERLLGATVTAPVSHIVTMRYHPGIHPAARLRLGSRVLAIRGIQDLEERHAELRLACEEIR